MRNVCVILDNRMMIILLKRNIFSAHYSEKYILLPGDGSQGATFLSLSLQMQFFQDGNWTPWHFQFCALVIGSGRLGINVTRRYMSALTLFSLQHCFAQNKKLTGALIKACDLLGVPPPSILSPSILSQVVTCHTSGPCPDGMVISVTQFCSPL